MTGPIAGPSGHRVEGVALADGVDRFVGVPYAAPPTGRLRFAPAQPHASWPGVRAAIDLGPGAPQNIDPFVEHIPAMIGATNPPPDRTDEDCLTVDIWAPSGAQGLPVLVWIHGGAFVGGTGSAAWYDGAVFASREQVVVVTVNYRLGLLGAIDAAESGDPQAGDFVSIALRDQLAALRWVARSIHAFGGDPYAVTVAGESAGAISVLDLLAAPASEGLIHRAIAQSGSTALGGDAGDGRGRSRAVLQALGVAPGVGALERLRAVPTRRLLDLQLEERFGLLAPAVDGRYLPQPARAALRSGASARVPLIIGSNGDESRSLHAILSGAPAQGAFEHELGQRLVDVDAGFRAVYPRVADERWGDVVDDRDWRGPARADALAHAAAGGTSYVYEFEWPTTGMGGALGSAHQAELPFVFGTLAAAARSGLFPPDLDSQQDAIDQSEVMRSAWGAFVREGVPSTAGFHWPPYKAEAGPTAVFAAGRVRAVTDFRRRQIEYWHHDRPA